MTAVAVRKKVTKFLSSITAILFICYIRLKAIVCIGCTENQRKIGPSQMSYMSYTQNDSTRRPALLTDMLSCICMLTSKLFIIPFKTRKKDS